MYPLIVNERIFANSLLNNLFYLQVFRTYKKIIVDNTRNVISRILLFIVIASSLLPAIRIRMVRRK